MTRKIEQLKTEAKQWEKRASQSIAIEQDLRAEIERLETGLNDVIDRQEDEIEQLKADKDVQRSQERNASYEAGITKLETEIKQLRSLVQCLLDEDPNDLAADGGVTVLDVWRKQARTILERKP